MRFSKKIISLVLIVVFSCMSLIYATAKGERQFFIRDIRALGMGGANICLSDDQNAFFYNPAGITKREKGMFTLFNMNISISDDILEGYDWFSDNQEDLENFEDLSSSRKVDILNDITDTITNYRLGLKFGLPNINYISGPKRRSRKLFWGWGLFDQLDINFRMDSGLLIPNVDIWGNADVAFMIPIAYKLTDSFSVGGTFKYLSRIGIEERRLSILAFEGLDFLLQPGSGIGIDLGATYNLKDNLQLGMQVTDFGGTTVKYDRVTETKTEDGVTTTQVKDERVGVIFQRVNVGVSYKPLKDFIRIPFMPDITFAADLRNITNAEEDEKLLKATFWKKLHFGAEVAWKYVNARIGFNSGYPTCGIGFAMPLLSALKFDYAYYTDELGKYAGDNPESNHVISLSCRFGATLSKKKMKVSDYVKKPKSKMAKKYKNQKAHDAKLLKDFELEQKRKARELEKAAKKKAKALKKENKKKAKGLKNKSKDKIKDKLDKI